MYDLGDQIALPRDEHLAKSVRQKPDLFTSIKNFLAEMKPILLHCQRTGVISSLTTCTWLKHVCRSLPWQQLTQGITLLQLRLIDHVMPKVCDTSWRIAERMHCGKWSRSWKYIAIAKVAGQRLVEFDTHLLLGWELAESLPEALCRGDAEALS